MGKSDKLYSKSPSLKKDKESGDVSVEKPKPADAEDAGLAGDNEDGDPAQMPISEEKVDDMQKRHMKEMKDTHARHEGETKDMHKRHMKEVSSLTSKKDEK